MGIASPRIVVVDDKREHGEAIVRKLWQMGHASLFVEYDQQRLIDREYGPFGGVRLIFMDLDLAGEGRIGDGSRAYADVQAVVEAILDEGNGPWALVTWTGHADHAEQLWDHLQERLPVHLRPLSRQVMNKEVLLADGKDAGLIEELQTILAHQDAVRCLLNWEAGVLDSANEVIAELVKVAATLDGNSAENLGALLFELARAKAGKTIDQHTDFSQPLYKVLTALLSDRLGSGTTEDEHACSSDYMKELESVELAGWKRRINTMINLEIYNENADTKASPGLLTQLPEAGSIQVLSELDTEKGIGKFIRRHFLCFQKAVNSKTKKEISSQCELFLMEITPPCDHAQKKSVWRRFAVVCLLPCEYIEHAWNVDFTKDQNQVGRLKGEYLRVSPEFMDEEGGFVLLVNANLQLALPEDQLDNLGKAKYRVKDAMLADWMGWLGRHATRLGHVWLSTH